MTNTDWKRREIKKALRARWRLWFDTYRALRKSGMLSRFKSALVARDMVNAMIDVQILKIRSTQL